MSMKPLILLSNDDGVASPYLQRLADQIDAAGFAESLVIAPERQRSAASHAITLHKPLRLHEHAPGRHSLSGTPVDCVYLGIIKLSPRRPVLVISGINRGYNLGHDIFYSGTVAAAVEGGLRGVPALALSMDPSSSADLDGAVRFSLALVKRALAVGMPAKTILNVNFPARAAERYAWTRLGHRAYADDVECRTDPRGAPYYWIGGGHAKLGDEPYTDCGAISRGVVSITPLSLDLSAHAILDDDGLFDVGGYQEVEWSQAPVPTSSAPVPPGPSLPRPDDDARAPSESGPENSKDKP